MLENCGGDRPSPRVLLCRRRDRSHWIELGFEYLWFDRAKHFPRNREAACGWFRKVAEACPKRRTRPPCRRAKRAKSADRHRIDGHSSEGPSSVRSSRCLPTKPPASSHSTASRVNP